MHATLFIESDQETKSFDFGEFVPAEARWKRVRRTYADSLILICTLISLLIAVALLYGPLSDHISFAEYEHAAIGLFGAGVMIYIGLAVRGSTSPGASSLLLNDRGMELRYSSGRVDTVEWSDPKVRFSIVDFTERSPAEMAGIPCVLELPGRALPPGWTRPLTVLSAEARDAILQSVARFGLSMTPARTGMLSSWGPRAWVYSVNSQKLP